MSRPLFGHVSPETAYIVHNYPFGGGLRCIMRYWIETTKSGMRVCQQTTKKEWNREYTADTFMGPPAESFWNKPKKSVYCDLRVLFLDEKDHCHSLPLSYTSPPSSFATFDRVIGELPEDVAAVRERVERISRSYNKRDWEEFDKEKVC